TRSCMAFKRPHIDERNQIVPNAGTPTLTFWDSNSFDNFGSISADIEVSVIPEPTTIGLVGLELVAPARKRRRWSISSLPARSQQRAPQHDDPDREINHEPGAVDERGDERRRRSRRIEAKPAQQERQQRSDERAPDDDADEGQGHGHGDKQPVRAINRGEGRPTRDPHEADRSENAA